MAARRRFFSSREPHRVFHPGEKGFGDRYAAETAAEREASILDLSSIERKERKRERKEGRVVVPREDDFAGR